ncbi:MAG: 16S rRNA (uracil(1498)-N(3))-methyltransferase [Cyclobacteriaceae bacterium]
MHLFYQANILEDTHLTDDEHHHCIKVLRHSVNDEIHVTNGKGTICKAIITSIEKRKTKLSIADTVHHPQKDFRLNVLIAPTKQMERMEWFVEKTCEMGVDEITFLKTKNIERPHLKLDRLEKKAVSALKQSKGAWKTKINPLTPFSDIVETKGDIKLIAAVNENSTYLMDSIKPNRSVSILIGPEGDFTMDEIKLATKAGFQPISLGHKVLRTETAGVFVAAAANLINGY